MIGKKGSFEGIAVVICIIVVLGIVFSSAFYEIVDAGNVGVPKTFGEVEDYTLEPGFHLKNPFTKVYEMSYQIQKVEYDSSAASKDLQMVTTKIALNFQLNKNIPSGCRDRHNLIHRPY